MAVVKVSCIKGVHEVKEGETVDISLIEFTEDESDHSVDDLPQIEPTE